jgi:hypothetical protein
MTGLLAQLDSRFNPATNLSSHSSGSDREGTRFVISEYHRAVCVRLGTACLSDKRSGLHTSRALAVTNTAFQMLPCLAASICVRTWAVEALGGAFIVPAQYLSPPKLFEGREVVFFGVGRIMIVRCNFYGKLDSVSKKFGFTYLES